MDSRRIPKQLLILLSATLTLLSCFGNSGSKPTSNRQQPATKNASSIRLIQPKNGSNITNGGKLTIQYSKQNEKIDSAVAYLDGKRLISFVDTLARVVVNAQTFGEKNISVKFFSNGNAIRQAAARVNVLPATPPKQYSYKVVAEYPHSEHAYTQGLQYADEFMYEGTGGYGTSSLQRLDLKTGKTLQVKNLDKTYFGEGICLLNGLIYQLTWREQRCLVYDAKTLDQKATLSYSGEGWGLTTDGTHLIMSDGSHRISYRSPQDFSVVKRLEVCSNNGYVNLLNELELIEGELWANVYTTEQIVRIDTASGAVIGVISCKGLLPKALITPQTDVLNGIAYDAARKRIFVTGKNWKRLYEIVAVEL
jgi:glutamine cyclotransferase